MNRNDPRARVTHAHTTGLALCGALNVGSSVHVRRHYDGDRATCEACLKILADSEREQPT
jgi:hypothetical protein